MRQLQSKYSTTLFRSTQMVGMVLGIGGMVFLGAVCEKTATNINSSNSEINSSISNTNENTTSAEIDTSDWLTYTNEEYGFSFRYPREWHISDKTSIQVPDQYQLVITAGESYDPNDYEFVLYVEQITLEEKYDQVKTALNKDTNKVILSETSQSTISKTIKVKTKSSNTNVVQTMVEIENNVISYSCAEGTNKLLCNPVMNTFRINI